MYLYTNLPEHLGRGGGEGRREGKEMQKLTKYLVLKKAHKDKKDGPTSVLLKLYPSDTTRERSRIQRKDGRNGQVS